MSRKARVKSISGIYHIMLRGANRQEIFHDEEDCRTFLGILQKYKQQSNMMIYAWCLMGNHVHLLVKQGDEALSITMKRIGVSYVLYYNQKYGTCGHLFQDRFKSEIVDERRYLFTVIRYIHQNPLKAGMVRRMEEWRWSSYRSYFGTERDERLLDSDYIFGLVADDPSVTREKFKEFNERVNQDECLEYELPKRRLTDEEAREAINTVLQGLEIAQVKSLPGNERKIIFQKIKAIKGLSQRQTERILGISRKLISKA